MRPWKRGRGKLNVHITTKTLFRKIVRKGEGFKNVQKNVHIVYGSLLIIFLKGCPEFHGKSSDHPDYLAAAFQDFGYLKLITHNYTHLQLDYISTEQVSGIKLFQQQPKKT